MGGHSPQGPHSPCLVLPVWARGLRGGYVLGAPSPQQIWPITKSCQSSRGSLKSVLPPILLAPPFILTLQPAGGAQDSTEPVPWSHGLQTTQRAPTALGFKFRLCRWLTGHDPCPARALASPGSVPRQVPGAHSAAGALCCPGNYPLPQAQTAQGAQAAGGAPTGRARVGLEGQGVAPPTFL